MDSIKVLPGTYNTPTVGTSIMYVFTTSRYTVALEDM